MGITTDKNDPALKSIGADGQQKAYLVLSEEERAKGFVRPVRASYIHVGIPGPRYPLRDLTQDEHERYDKFGYVQFEAYPIGDSSSGRYWTQPDLDRVNHGCQQKTSMGPAIAETYARNPKFYGGTFCSYCGRHFPVGPYGEFVWANAPDERVGT